MFRNVKKTICILSVGLVSLSFGVNVNAKEVKEYVFEYGHKISKKDIKNMVTGKKNKKTKDLKLKIDGKKEEGCNYYAVGEYKASIKGKNMKPQKVKIKIMDTKAPEITSSDIININLNDTTNLLNYIHASDLSEMHVEADTSTVNVAQAGDYVVHVVVRDNYGNETSKDITYRVNDPYAGEYSNVISSELKSDSNRAIGDYVYLQLKVNSSFKTGSGFYERLKTMYQFYNGKYNLGQYRNGNPTLSHIEADFDDGMPSFSVDFQTGKVFVYSSTGMVDDEFNITF